MILADSLRTIQVHMFKYNVLLHIAHNIWWELDIFIWCSILTWGWVMLKSYKMRMTRSIADINVNFIVTLNCLHWRQIGSESKIRKLSLSLSFSTKYSYKHNSSVVNWIPDVSSRCFPIFTSWDEVLREKSRLHSVINKALHHTILDLDPCNNESGNTKKS